MIMYPIFMRPKYNTFTFSCSTFISIIQLILVTVFLINVYSFSIHSSTFALTVMPREYFLIIQLLFWRSAFDICIFKNKIAFTIFIHNKNNLSYIAMKHYWVRIVQNISTIAIFTKNAMSLQNQLKPYLWLLHHIHCLGCSCRYGNFWSPV